MSDSKSSKIFIFLMVLTGAMSIVMLVLVFQIKGSQRELKQLNIRKKNVFKYADDATKAKKILEKIKIKTRGGGVSLSLATLERFAQKESSRIHKSSPIKLDRDDYVEKGLMIKIRSIERTKLARLLAKIETEIVGAKIRSLSIKAHKSSTARVETSFDVVKSYSKSIEEQ